MLIGTIVKMSDSLKKEMGGPCRLAGKHLGPFDPGNPNDRNDPGGDCWGPRCSWEHVKKFEDCIGVIIGWTDYNNCRLDDPEYNLGKLGPEVDVRWQPSNLRYCYDPKQLDIIL